MVRNGGTKRKRSSEDTSRPTVRFLRADRRIVSANDNVRPRKRLEFRKLVIYGLVLVLVASLVAAFTTFF